MEFQAMREGERQSLINAQGVYISQVCLFDLRQALMSLCFVKHIKLKLNALIMEVINQKCWSTKSHILNLMLLDEINRNNLYQNRKKKRKSSIGTHEIDIFNGRCLTEWKILSNQIKRRKQKMK